MPTTARCSPIRAATATAERAARARPERRSRAVSSSASTCPSNRNVPHTNRTGGVPAAKYADPLGEPAHVVLLAGVEPELQREPRRARRTPGPRGSAGGRAGLSWTRTQRSLSTSLAEALVERSQLRLLEPRRVEHRVAAGRSSASASHASSQLLDGHDAVHRVQPRGLEPHRQAAAQQEARPARCRPAPASRRARRRAGPGRAGPTRTSPTGRRSSSSRAGA